MTDNIIIIVNIFWVYKIKFFTIDYSFQVDFGVKVSASIEKTSGRHKRQEQKFGVNKQKQMMEATYHK